MAEPIIVVQSAADLGGQPLPVRLVDADDYLVDPAYAKGDYYVINLCRSYRYQSVGYYCSLLAEARGQRVVPSVSVILDLSRKALYETEISLISGNASRAPAGVEPLLPAKILVFFGQCKDPRWQVLAQRAFESFPAPLLEMKLGGDAGAPSVIGLRTRSLRSLNAEQHSAMQQALAAHLARGWRRARAVRHYRYDLAVLVNPAEVQPPSDARALRRFVRAGRELGLAVDFIQARDFGRLAEFDALFIRETTAMNHHSYRFARRAEKEGLVVIDDPTSILRCTNKVYLAELLAAKHIAAPKTCIFGEAEVGNLAAALGFPMVLKVPEGAFSKGVFKADNAEQLQSLAAMLLKDSELALAQEFLPTEFDWRIGVLNGQPLYACQYLMARKHWQIVKHEENGRFQEGGFRTFALADVPADVVRIAVRAANLIGKGLYGVDIKPTASGPKVIEINDNPSIDAGVEDAALGAELYRSIMREFLRRLEMRGKRTHPAV